MYHRIVKRILCQLEELRYLNLALREKGRGKKTHNFQGVNSHFKTFTAGTRARFPRATSLILGIISISRHEREEVFPLETLVTPNSQHCDIDSDSEFSVPSFIFFFSYPF